MLGQEKFHEAGSHFSTSESHVTYAWKMTLKLASFMSVKDGGLPTYEITKNDYPTEVDFDLVHKGIRFQETGAHRHLFLGRIAWNTVTEINNSNILSNDSRYIVDWVDTIHPQFRYSHTRRMRAAEELAKIYIQLRECPNPVN